MEQEFIIVAVGEKLPIFTNAIEDMKYQNCGLFEASETGEGFYFLGFYDNPTIEEIEMFQTEDILYRILRGQDNLILPLFQFKDSKTIFEISFDPTKYSDNRGMRNIIESNIITTLLIDSSTGIVKAIRSGNLPKKFSQSCGEAWSKAMVDANYSQKFDHWMMINGFNSLESLWDQAIDVGKFGE